MQLIETQAVAERAILVAAQTPEQDEARTRELLAELEALAATYGATVVDRQVYRLRAPRGQYFLGTGNAEKLAQECHTRDVNLLIFDDILTPGQQRNWEKLAGIKVIDRQELILQIFGQRASTREAELQIHLATAEYQLPRLHRAWTHLSRQRGGVGLQGGPGEQQREVDSRRIRERIQRLKQELVVVRRRRAEQRKQRREIPVPTAAIVGYTNAGKSSLLNMLTQAHVFVEDKLFATLDPTTRRVRLPNHQTLLLTDTVGFVRKLPHALVAAFRATLEEAVTADALIHVVDASNPSALEHIETTDRVLAEVGVGKKPTILVFNKMDLVTDTALLRPLRRRFPEAVFLSVKSGAGRDDLLAQLVTLVSARMTTVNLRMPAASGELLAFLHRTCNVLSQTVEDDAILVHAAVPHNCLSAVQAYQVTKPD